MWWRENFYLKLVDDDLAALATIVALAVVPADWTMDQKMMKYIVKCPNDDRGATISTLEASGGVFLITVSFELKITGDAEGCFNRANSSRKNWEASPCWEKKWPGWQRRSRNRNQSSLGFGATPT